MANPTKIGNTIFSFTVTYVLILVNLLQPSNGHCWQEGENPLMSAPPKVTQSTATSVKVSWANIVNRRECAADYFIVRYWKSSSPKNYLESALHFTNADYIILEGIVPGVSYTYEVKAVQRKGGIIYTDVSAQVTFSGKNAYCWQEDIWTHFTAPPNITQITPTTVQVSWIASHQECADILCIVYWKSSSQTKSAEKPREYLEKSLYSPDYNKILVRGIEPEIQYSYKVGALQVKDGIYYTFDSEMVAFTTKKNAPSRKSWKRINALRIDSTTETVPFAAVMTTQRRETSTFITGNGNHSSLEVKNLLYYQKLGFGLLGAACVILAGVIIVVCIIVCTLKLHQNGNTQETS